MPQFCEQEVLKDVAARIIQHYARQWLKRRRPREVQAWPAGSESPTHPSTASLRLGGSVLDFMPLSQQPRRSASCEAAGRVNQGRQPPRPPTSRSRNSNNAASTSGAQPPAVLSPRNRLPCSPCKGTQSRRTHEQKPQEFKPSTVMTPSNASPPTCPGVAAGSTEASPRLEDSAKSGASGKAGTDRTSPLAAAKLAALSPAPTAAAQRPAVVMVAHAAAEPPAPRDCGGSSSLSSVLKLLDRLEAQAAAEQSQLASLPTATGASASGGAAPATAVATQSLSLPVRRTVVGAALQPSFAAACTDAVASSTVRKCEWTAGMAAGAAPPQAAEQDVRSATDEGDGEVEAVRGAAAVAAGVRGKIQRLQQAVADKDCQIAALASRAEALAAAQQAALAAAAQQRAAALADAMRDHEAEVAKLRASVQRVEGEKEALAARCSQLLADLSGLQAECARQIGALKEGVARELRRQKELWVAGERSKREAWMAEKEKSIKEATVRGLEPEVQKLVAAHNEEMRRAEKRWEAESARRLAAAADAHKEEAARLRSAGAAEAAAAAAAERAAAQRAADEAAARFEGELCALRLRLAAEHQVALERSEAGRREDRSAHEERLRQLAREHEQRLAALRAEWEEDRAAATTRHTRELAAAREQAAVGQEAWRAAVSERAAREAEAREAALRRQLAAERDEELRAVVSRLEAEALAREQALEAETAEARQRAKARGADELRRARQEGERAAERAAAAEGRLERLEALLHTLQAEVAGKSAAISQLEAAAQRDAEARRAEAETAAAVLAEREAGQREAVEKLESRAAAAERRAAAAEQGLRDATEEREREMAALEARVQAALRQKDGTIAALRRQLDELHAVCA